MPELAVHGPLDERGLHDNLRTHPVCAELWQADGLREGRRRQFDGVEAPSQIQQEPGVETRADLAGIDEIAVFVVPDQQGAEADARALRIGKSADDEFLRRLALHLQPMLRAAMLVRRAAPFRNDAFPALPAGTLPRFLVVEQCDATHRRIEWQFLQERASIFKRQRRHGASIQPEDVEHVIALLAVPGHLAVENHLVDREPGDRAGQRRQMLRQPVA